MNWLLDNIKDILSFFLDMMMKLWLYYDYTISLHVMEIFTEEFTSEKYILECFKILQQKKKRSSAGGAQ